MEGLCPCGHEPTGSIVPVSQLVSQLIIIHFRGVSPVFPYHKFHSTVSPYSSHPFRFISSALVMVRQAWSAGTLATHGPIISRPDLVLDKSWGIAIRQCNIFVYYSYLCPVLPSMIPDFIAIEGVKLQGFPQRLQRNTQLHFYENLCYVDRQAIYLFETKEYLKRFKWVGQEYRTRFERDQRVG